MKNNTPSNYHNSKKEHKNRVKQSNVHDYGAAPRKVLNFDGQDHSDEFANGGFFSQVGEQFSSAQNASLFETPTKGKGEGARSRLGQDSESAKGKR